MSKFVYCANCGMKLPIFKKAVPNARVVIDMVEKHECLPEPIELDLKPVVRSAMDSPRASGKFSDRLEKLTPPLTFKIPTDEEAEDSGELRDRRFDKANSTAPGAVIDQVKNRFNTE